mgnify:CR=1 FL=1
MADYAGESASQLLAEDKAATEQEMAEFVLTQRRPSTQEYPSSRWSQVSVRAWVLRHVLGTGLKNIKNPPPYFATDYGFFKLYFRIFLNYILGILSFFRYFIYFIRAHVSRLCRKIGHLGDEKDTGHLPFR